MKKFPTIGVFLVIFLFFNVANVLTTLRDGNEPFCQDVRPCIDSVVIPWSRYCVIILFNLSLSAVITTLFWKGYKENKDKK